LYSNTKASIPWQHDQASLNDTSKLVDNQVVVLRMLDHCV